MECGHPLQYHDKARSTKCTSCGEENQGHIVCQNGHYICEQCHNRDALLVVEDFIISTELMAPNEIAEQAFLINELPMLGCQHAYIAGGALMAALKNHEKANVTSADIHEIFKRIRKQAHGGYCGLTGVCGIVVAIGACFAVLTGSKCGTTNEQKTTMEAVTKVTGAITDLTGPSCCKAYVRGALKAALVFLEENFIISLPEGKASSCQFSSRHPHGCRKEDCPYFSTTNSESL